jgi:hypothetical protein
MIWLKRLAVFALAFGLGVVLGPLLSAVMAGLYPVREAGVPLAGAMRLLEAYEARVPGHDRPAGLSWEAAARACGYEPAAVMDAEVAPGAAWSPVLGYFDLRMWQGSEARADMRAEQAARLAAALTPFQMGFYRQCMAGSAFAPLCQRRVAAALAEPAPQAAFSAMPAPRSRETICHFLDGVAARRGKPLAVRDGVLPLPGPQPAPETAVGP